MGGLAREQRHARRAAQRHGAEMLLEEGALVGEVLLEERLVVERIEVQVLVVGHDEDEVGLARGPTMAAGRVDVVCRDIERVQGQEDRREEEQREAHRDERSA